MTKNEKLQALAEIVNQASTILVVQADNPDGDSLSSALALEEILSDAGKKVHLYCGVEIPNYLRYLKGWDRVESQLPKDFDSVLIVDAGNEILLEQLEITGQKAQLKSKPTAVIDHHLTPTDITWAKVDYTQEAVSTTELIYKIASELGWSVSLHAKELLAVGMLSDSLGLTTEATTAATLRVLAELVEGGVSLPKLENARRATLKRQPELVHYKGQLLQRVEYLVNNRIALVVIPWEEIEKYSPLYNPSMLVIDDMRLASGTAVAICFKQYPDGRITAKIRCNFGYPIGNSLAEQFGGGGHPYAAGFKVTDKPFDQLRAETVQKATELLDNLEGDQQDETL